MTRRRMGRRHVFAMLAAFGIAVIGCHRNRGDVDLRGGTAESEDEVVASAPGHLGGPLGGAKTHGISARPTPDMRKDINSMSDADFVDYLSRLQYDTHPGRSHLAEAQCQHGDDPTKSCGTTESATVYIEPEIGAHQKGMPTAGSHGFIVARIINYDPSDRITTGMQLQPHTRYWWVVNYDPQTHAAHSIFVKRNYHSVNPLDTIPGTWGFYDCHHNTTYSRAEAKFGTCKGFLPQYTAAIKTPSARSDVPESDLGRYIHSVAFHPAATSNDQAMVAALLSGGWISCPTGCCSTSQ